MKDHFEHVASIYDFVRDTDMRIVEHIMPELPGCRHPVNVADIGCGTGRYSKIIAEKLKNKFRFFCCDYSSAMLAECRRNIKHGVFSDPFYYCRVQADDLPFNGRCFDAVVTFNAVHHFDLEKFMNEAARVLRIDGLLAIYTRTPEQNARTVWGQYFPGFIEHETRLYQRNRLEEAVKNVSKLQLEGIQEIIHNRTEPPELLLKRARHGHYSTFALYSKEEFKRALKTFAERMAELTDGGMIRHTAENTLVLARIK